MKNLIFIGHDNLGDSILSSIVASSMFAVEPNVGIHIFNKNSCKMAFLFDGIPSIKHVGFISTKIAKLPITVFCLYKTVKALLKQGDVAISSLIGSSTLHKCLLPFLLLNKYFGKNKIHILQLKPLFGKSPITQNLVSYHLGLLSKIMHINIPMVFHHPVQCHKQHKTVALCVGASKAWKALEPEKFAKIALFFSKKGYKVKILAGTSTVDAKQAENTMKLLKNTRNIQNLTGRTSIAGFVKEVASASVVIANDSSPQHICQLFQTPCVTIWGRYKDSNTVKAYCWNDDFHLNIFNEPYTFEGKVDKMGTNKRLIKLNLQIIPAERIINEISKWQNKLNENA